MVNDNNFIVIQGWMVRDLKLKGNDLLLYACIYGFSQAESQVYSGSLQYLADWTNSTKQGVLKSLKKLLGAGLIQKNERFINGVKFVEYYATEFNGIKQSLTNNIIGDNIELKKENIKEKNDLLSNDLLSDVDSGLKQTLLDFIDMRKKIKKPLTARALELTIKKLNELSSDVNKQVQILEQSITNSWCGVFPLKNGKGYTNKKAVGYEQRDYSDTDLDTLFDSLDDLKP